MDTSHENIDLYCAGYVQGEKPDADLPYKGFFHWDGVTLSYCDGSNWYPVRQFGSVVNIDGVARSGSNSTIARADHTHAIEDNTITTSMLQDSLVTTDKILNLNVTTAKLGDGAVTNIKLGNDIDASKLTVGTIPSARIATNAINNDRLAANAVKATNINTDAVTTVKIKDRNVTSDKIAEDAITSFHLSVSGVDAGVYGTTTRVPYFTVDADGRITSAGQHQISTDAISSLSEYITDTVGAMVVGNNETGLSVTFNNSTNKLNFSLTADPKITLTGAVTGEGTMTNLGDVEIETSVDHNHDSSYYKKADVYTKTQSDTNYYKKADVYTKTESDDNYYKKADVYTKTESDTNYYKKADVYTKTESDTNYYKKADVYTKTESDTNYYKKADVYTKSESDTNYYKKADVYTETEVDTLVNAKLGNSGRQEIHSAPLTGTAPTGGSLILDYQTANNTGYSGQEKGTSLVLFSQDPANVKYAIQLRAARNTLYFREATHSDLVNLDINTLFYKALSKKSSREIKHDINTYNETASSIISELRPVTFVYNDDSDEKVNIGFIAEEVAAALPLAGLKTNDGINGYDTEALLSVTIKAMQELQQEVIDLRKEVALLKK